MEATRTLKNQRERRLNNWRQFAIDLHEQLSESKTEIAVEFEKQKKNLKSKIDEYLEDLRYAQNLSVSSMENVVKSLEDLRKKAESKVIDSNLQVLEQHKELSEGIGDVRKCLATDCDSNHKETLHFFAKMDDRFQFVNTQFGLLRIQLQLGEEKLMKEWEERKKEVKAKLETFKSKLEESEEDIENGWKEYTDHMKEIWKDFQTTLKK